VPPPWRPELQHTNLRGNTLSDIQAMARELEKPVLHEHLLIALASSSNPVIYIYSTYTAQICLGPLCYFLLQEKPSSICLSIPVDHHLKTLFLITYLNMTHEICFFFYSFL
jgi:hypothetical protein